MIAIRPTVFHLAPRSDTMCTWNLIGIQIDCGPTEYDQHTQGLTITSPYRQSTGEQRGMQTTVSNANVCDGKLMLAGTAPVTALQNCDRCRSTALTEGATPVETETVSPRRRRLSVLLAATSAALAGLMAVGALAAPAQAWTTGSWNHSCRAEWDNYEAWSYCNSNANGVGQVKLTVDRKWENDYSGNWLNAKTGWVDGPVWCFLECRSAAVSRSGV